MKNFQAMYSYALDEHCESKFDTHANLKDVFRNYRKIASNILLKKIELTRASN